eukprot:3585078-Pleurochrysis_carterae.AAC.1
MRTNVTRSHWRHDHHDPIVKQRKPVNTTASGPPINMRKKPSTAASSRKEMSAFAASEFGGNGPSEWRIRARIASRRSSSGSARTRAEKRNVSVQWHCIAGARFGAAQTLTCESDELLLLGKI